MDSRQPTLLVNSRLEMDFRRRALLLLLCLTATFGCRQSAAQRELLERELRLQEDRIYELESKLEDSQRTLERLQGKLPAGEFCPPTSSGPSQILPDGTLFTPRSVIIPAPASPAESAPTLNPADIPHDTAPPKVELPMGMRTEVLPPFAGMPVISPPDLDKPEGLPSRAVVNDKSGADSGGGLSGMLAELLPKEATGLPKAEPVIKEMSSPKFRAPSEVPRVEMPGADSSRRETSAQPVTIGQDQIPSDINVASIGLHRSTGGWNVDGTPGDEGVFILLEPRNARGQVVPTIGDVSLVLIDPAIIGEGGRYARWDFTAQDAAATYRPAVAGGSAGLHFELAWPDGPPTHSRLKLFVRFTTQDGKRFQAEKDLKLELGAAATGDGSQDLKPVPLTATRPPVTSNAAQPAGAVNIARDRATLAVPQAEPAAAPLRWGGPKVSPLPAPKPLSLPNFDAAPQAPAAVEQQGPQLGPALGGPTMLR
ncbi:MAG: hypothetical protein C0483_13080 [Pirellula sp.]|nr:hypothetical protein [Pirellula sp.]